MNELKPIELEYIYVTIPAEYICVYHRILAMMADYGEDMLKDCKASCTDRNSGIIECFNMFNSAVAARKLGKEKLASVIITYIKAKINQIYKDKDNSTSFVFPVDETGQLKAFVSCGERPKFEINADDGELYEHKLHNGFDEHFRLGVEDGIEEEIESIDTTETDTTSPVESSKLSVTLTPRYEKTQYGIRPCADIIVKYNGLKVNVNDTDYQYYFDDKPVIRFNDIANLSTGVHNFKIVVTYKEETKIVSEDKYFSNYSDKVKISDVIKPDDSNNDNDGIDMSKLNLRSLFNKNFIKQTQCRANTSEPGQVYYTRIISFKQRGGISNEQIVYLLNTIENNTVPVDDNFSITHVSYLDSPYIQDINTPYNKEEVITSISNDTYEYIHLLLNKKYYVVVDGKGGVKLYKDKPYGVFRKKEYPKELDITTLPSSTVIRIRKRRKTTGATAGLSYYWASIDQGSPTLDKAFKVVQVGFKPIRINGYKYYGYSKQKDTYVLLDKYK